jgi:hypothetical protein
LKKQPGFDIQKAMRSICSRLSEGALPVVCDSDVESVAGNLDPTRLTDAFSWISAGAVKYRTNGDSESPVRVSVTRDVNGDQARIEWTGFATIDHDPFKSFAGSDEIRMSLAAKIIEAHGGSVQHDKNRFLATLPLSD